MKTRKGASYTAAALLLAAGLALSCSSDSPTRPRPQPGTSPPGGGNTNTTFAVSVSVSPAELLIDDPDGSIVTVNVRRNDTGQAPPDGATVTLTTTRGSFGSPNSGQQSVVVELDNGSGTVRFFGGSTEGSALIRATIDQSAGQATVLVRSEEAFALFSVSPPSSDPAGGDVLTITGQGFEAPVDVTFLPAGANQAVTAQVLSVSPTQVRVIIPPSPVSVPSGQTLTVNLQVTNEIGTVNQAVRTLSGVFTYALGGSLLRPVITTLTPQSGPNEGGTRVRILGDGFESPVQVLFGNGGNPDSFQGIEAVVESISRSELVVITPSAFGVGQDNRDDFVDVLVRNQRTGAAVIRQSAFKYGQTSIFISSIGPGAGPYQGGTRVTLFGNGFDAPVAVSFAGFPARQVISVTGTEVLAMTDGIAVTSCNDVAGPTRIVNIETSVGTDGPEFTYIVPRALIVDVDPSVLPAVPDPSSTVTVTGQNFEDPVRVLFGDSAGGNPMVSDDGTEIVVNPPAFNGNFPTEDCTTTDGLEGNQAQPVRVDLRVTNLFTTCTDVFPNGITYNPPDSDCIAELPTPSFNFSVNDTVVFFQNTSDNATSFLWDFGDGSPNSSAISPTHDYAASVAPGDTEQFTVVLTATNSNGSQNTNRVVQVTAPAPPPPPPPPP